jgi:RecB family exonuclease
VDWSDTADPEAAAAAWSAGFSGTEGLRRRVLAAFGDLLRSAEVRAALARPPGDVTLWREKRFDIVIDGSRLVSGVFDRVVIRRDGDGRVAGAEVLDFKTDRMATPADPQNAERKYRPQLALYAQALGRILGLEPDRIARRLVLVDARAVRSLA